MKHTHFIIIIIIIINTLSDRAGFKTQSSHVMHARVRVCPSPPHLLVQQLSSGSPQSEYVYICVCSVQVHTHLLVKQLSSQSLHSEFVSCCSGPCLTPLLL